MMRLILRGSIFAVNIVRHSLQLEEGKEESRGWPWTSSNRLLQDILHYMYIDNGLI